MSSMVDAFVHALRKHSQKVPQAKAGHPGVLHPKILMMQPPLDIALELHYNMSLEPSLSIERFMSYETSNNQKISAQLRGISACFLVF